MRRRHEALCDIAEPPRPARIAHQAIRIAERIGAIDRDDARAGSAFARADPARSDWDAQLGGASWLVLSGVTPAIGSLANSQANATAPKSFPSM